MHQKDNTVSFTARVEDIARQRLLSDQKLLYMPPDGAHKELMKEMDRSVQDFWEKSHIVCIYASKVSDCRKSSWRTSNACRPLFLFRHSEFSGENIERR
jgi:hypothetical protein